MPFQARGWFRTASLLSFGSGEVRASDGMLGRGDKALALFFSMI